MRIRHIKGSEEYVAASELVIAAPSDYKGSYNKEIFKNSNPIRLEVGMGMGSFIRKLSLSDPDINYIGFELNTTVLYKALKRYENELKAAFEASEDQGSLDGVNASEAQNACLSERSNLRFIRSDARFLTDYFAKGEIDRIYLNFSDPWPKDKNANKRLTSPVFLKLYREILKEDGEIEFKTDNRGLFDYSVETIPLHGFSIEKITYDLHNDAKMNVGNIMTEYEAKFSQKGNKIYKLIAKRC